MATCRDCGQTSERISNVLGVCGPCISAGAVVERPIRVTPVDEGDRSRKKRGVIPAMGFFDSLPANCIATWICPGTTGVGYPKFARGPTGEPGCKNLAVYFGGCSFDCLFCQDWIHEVMLDRKAPGFTIDEILTWLDDDTTCVCFCGGTPDVYLQDAIDLARAMRRTRSDAILRICAETNLTGNQDLMVEFAKEIHDSGGGLNIGFKAGTDSIHRALTGVSFEPVWRNFENLYQIFGKGEVVPFLRPSILLVPGYVDWDEVGALASFIASIDPQIPLKLIPFLPRHKMEDLPQSSRTEMQRAVEAAVDAGLQRVSPSVEEVGSGSRWVDRSTEDGNPSSHS